MASAQVVWLGHGTLRRLLPSDDGAFARQSRSLENMRDASFSRSSFDNVTKPARPSLTAAKRNDGVQKETASPWRSLYWWSFPTKDGRVGGLKTVIELLRIHHGPHTGPFGQRG